MATLATTIVEVISIPSDEQFKYVIRLEDKVPAMVKENDKYVKGESDIIWVTKRELLQCVPVRMRPLLTDDMLAYVLPDVKVEVLSKEFHLGDMLGGKPLEHDTIVHELPTVKTASIDIVKEAIALLK